MTKFILDSGDPLEYQKIATLAKDHGHELWGSTTNPSLIAKKLSGKKLTQKEAFELQKEIIYEIVEIVPGAVSAEVYADLRTEASEMVEQGREIASWHKRVVVKLPTTLEGFKARTELRKDNILTNNTLVFSQEQIAAICLHEELISQEYGKREGEWPTFISPFVGRLDDIGQDGLSLVEHGMEIKKHFHEPLWMLEASVRTLFHFAQGIALGSELITAPASIYQEWFTTPYDKKEISEVKKTELIDISSSIATITTLDDFIAALQENRLNISHPLTEKGIIRFTEDWQAILN